MRRSKSLTTVFVWKMCSLQKRKTSPKLIYGRTVSRKTKINPKASTMTSLTNLVSKMMKKKNRAHSKKSRQIVWMGTKSHVGRILRKIILSHFL
jgi:hypothetical protein